MLLKNGFILLFVVGSMILLMIGGIFVCVLFVVEFVLFSDKLGDIMFDEWLIKFGYVRIKVLKLLCRMFVVFE